MARTKKSAFAANLNVEPKGEPIELVLRGHGILGLAHIGVLRAFAHMGLRIERISAMSLTSVIATLFANGADSSEIEHLFLNRKSRRFMREAWIGHGQCHDKAIGKVQDLLPVARRFVERNRLKPKKMLRLLCFDVVEARTVVYEGTEYDLATALTACCSVPGLMRPIRRGDEVLVDCSLYGCRVDVPHTAASIIADVRAEGAMQDGILSRVDRWLDRRARYISRESDCDDITDCKSLVIDIRIPIENLTGCSCSEETIGRIVASGYDAAMKVLKDRQAKAVADKANADVTPIQAPSSMVAS